MLDGTYEMTVHIPFHKMSGTATLTSDGDAVDVLLEGMGMSHSARGERDGDAFTFRGNVSTPLGEMDFTLTGSVDGDAITANCATAMGTFKATGTRIA